MTTKQDALPKPPAHLSRESADWWRLVVSDFVLHAHHLKLLTLAAETWDRLTQARERIAKDGPFAVNRFGELRPHPALAVERDARQGFCRILRELGLDLAPDPDHSQPPPPARTGRKVW